MHSYTSLVRKEILICVCLCAGAGEKSVSILSIFKLGNKNPSPQRDKICVCVCVCVQNIRRQEFSSPQMYLAISKETVTNLYILSIELFLDKVLDDVNSS